MPNTTTIYTIKQASQYLGDGVMQAIESVIRFLPPDVKVSDSLAIAQTTLAHTITAISSTASRPLALIAKSNGTACTVKVYNDKAADVTVGTTDAVLSVGVSATSGDISATCAFGAGVKTLANGATADGISWAAPATDVGTGAVANDPDCYLLYANA